MTKGLLFNESIQSSYVEKSINTLWKKRYLRFAFFFSFLLWSLLVYSAYSALSSHTNFLNLFGNYTNSIFPIPPSNKHVNSVVEQVDSQNSERANTEPILDSSQKIESATTEPVLDSSNASAKKETILDSSQKNESLEAEAILNSSKMNESLEAEPILDSSQKNESAKTEPILNSSQKNESSKAEAILNSLQKNDSTKAEPILDLPQKNEIKTTEPILNLSQKNESSKAEPILDLSQKNESTETEPILDSSQKNESSKAEPILHSSQKHESTKTAPILDSCSGRYIYIHEIPSRFNTEILKNCDFLLKWKTDMCQAVSNLGLGPPIVDSCEILQNKTWFVTNPYLLEVIFHDRMRQYECLTDNSSRASVIYVPFYAGLDLGQYLWGFNNSMRDSGSIAMFKWLMRKPEWRRFWGRDHFFVVGRTTWDFRRRKGSDWGNRMMYMPQVKNITILGVESSHTIYKDFSIPYPTNFHPSNDNQVFEWQSKVRSRERKYLFLFVGGPRPDQKFSIRGEIIEQCLRAKEKCKWLECSMNKNCDDPIYVMEALQNAAFCLQPRGDTPTRRSTFDSILAGCIPVFFSVETAYTQYKWHLPDDHTKYSVFIPESAIKKGTTNIEEVLSRIPESQVSTMREEIIRLIPRIMFANPKSKLETLEDAFDIAVNGVLERVEKIKKIEK